MGMRLLQREVPEYEADLAGKSLQQQCRRLRRHFAIRTFEVGVLDHGDPGTVRPLRVISGFGRHSQGNWTGCLIHGGRLLRFQAPGVGNSMGRKVILMTDDLRKTLSSQFRSIQLASSKRCRLSMPSMGLSSMAIMRSPTATPARAAGLCGTISSTCTALVLAKP